MWSPKVFMRPDLSWAMAPTRKKKRQRRKTFFKEWREYRGLTQEQAAERLEVGQTSISRLERGLIPYSQDFLEKAAFAYMCEPQDLLMRDPTKEDSAWSLMDSLRAASPEEHEQIRRIVDALIKKAS